MNTEPTGFLHLAKIPLEAKARWTRAAQKSGMKLARWAEDVLDEAAANVLVEKTKDQPKSASVAREWRG